MKPVKACELLFSIKLFIDLIMHACFHGNIAARRLSLKIGQEHGDEDAGTHVWDAGLGDARPGTWGRVYGGTWGCVYRGDVRTRARGDVLTW